ncbi:hypothetical protein M0802_010349 [Mischocyttarus mexicanus]|nr:hypothetical protein M0802_010349 [Mischocyttarus mexicanus]
MVVAFERRKNRDTYLTENRREGHPATKRVPGTTESLEPRTSSTRATPLCEGVVEASWSNKEVEEVLGGLQGIASLNGHSVETNQRTLFTCCYANLLATAHATGQSEPSLLLFFSSDLTQGAEKPRTVRLDQVRNVVGVAFTSSFGFNDETKMRGVGVGMRTGVRVSKDTSNGDRDGGISGGGMVMVMVVMVLVVVGWMAVLVVAEQT